MQVTLCIASLEYGRHNVDGRAFIVLSFHKVRLNAGDRTFVVLPLVLENRFDSF